MEYTDPQIPDTNEVFVTAGDAPLISTETPSATAPTKFQADLARAMRAAAETARQESVERLAADSKARVETIRAESADAATELRQRADDDIAEIREWSKGELARIRGETDVKVGDRKSWLEHEIEAHDEAIEGRIAALASRVAAFEADLEAFFQRLAAESDPTRIAAIAQTLPDVPALDDEGAEPTQARDAGTPDAVAIASEAPADPWVEANVEVEVAAMAATDANTEAEPDANTDANTEATSDVAATDAKPEAEPQPESAGAFVALGRRLAALGIDPSAAEAAEAEAAVGLSADSTDEDGATEDSVSDIPIDETTAEAAPAPSEMRVVVDGLISVASIAGFKRNLSRLDGIDSVTVSSGPDGEFIFAVKHDPSAAIEAALPGMSGFGVRVTSVQAGQITVTARDPESADATADVLARR